MIISNNVEELENIGLYEFNSFKSFCLTRKTSNSSELDVNIILVKNTKGMLEELELNCCGARNIVITGNIDDVSSIVLAIEDIRNQQWENISFVVKDIADNAFKFYCRCFSLKI